MADEQILLDVQIDVDKAVKQLQVVNKSIELLKTEQSELKKAIKDGTGDIADNTRKLVENEKAMKLLQAESKSLTGQIQSENDVYRGLGDSFYELNAQMLQLEKEYKSLSAAERESAKGQDMKKKLIEGKQQLKDMDAEILNFQRNVGNYPTAFQTSFAEVDGILSKFGTNMGSVIKGGFNDLKLSIESTAKATKSFGRTLLTTPLGWILAALAALIAIFHKVVDAVKKNDDASTALSRLWSSFDPILKMLNKGFDNVAKAIGWVANKIADLLAKFSDEVKASQEVVMATDALEDKQREYAKTIEENEAKIAELREKVVDKEKYTAEQRIGFLEEAIDAEKDTLNKKKELVSDNLSALQDQIAKEYGLRKEQLTNEEEFAKIQGRLSDETKNKLNDANIAMIRAEKEYSSGMRKLTRELQATKKEAAAEDAQLVKEAQERRKEQAKADEEAAKEMADRLKREMQTRVEIERMAEDLLDNATKDADQRRLNQMKRQHQRELQALRDRLAEGKDMTLDAMDQLQQVIEDKEKAFADEEEQFADDMAKKRLDDRLAHIEEFGDAIKEAESEQNRAALDQLRERLEEELQAILDNEELTNEEKLRLRQEYLAKAEELTLTEIEITRAEIEDAQAKMRKSFLATAQSSAEAFGQISDLLADYGKQSKKAGEASKAFALTSIAINEAVSLANSAKAITEAVAGAAQAASAGGPAAPILIAAYTAEMVGIVLGAVGSVASTIKQAKAALNQKFAEGGIVEGTSYTGDKVDVKVNSREMILTTEQQAQLFELANGASPNNVAVMTEAFATAVSALPAPVLQYTEFEDFTKEVNAVRMAAEY